MKEMLFWSTFILVQFGWAYGENQNCSCGCLVEFGSRKTVTIHADAYSCYSARWTLKTQLSYQAVLIRFNKVVLKRDQWLQIISKDKEKELLMLRGEFSGGRELGLEVEGSLTIHVSFGANMVAESSISIDFKKLDGDEDSRGTAFVIGIIVNLGVIFANLINVAIRKHQIRKAQPPPTEVQPEAISSDTERPPSTTRTSVILERSPPTQQSSELKLSDLLQEAVTPPPTNAIIPPDFIPDPTSATQDEEESESDDEDSVNEGPPIVTSTPNPSSVNNGESTLPSDQAYPGEPSKRTTPDGKSSGSSTSLQKRTETEAIGASKLYSNEEKADDIAFSESSATATSTEPHVRKKIKETEL